MNQTENTLQAEPTPVAAAAAQVANESAAAAPKELAINVSGDVFYRICTYIGSKPLRQVVQLRQGLFSIQKEQNCLAPGALPEKVWLTESTVGTLMGFLADCPCDEVFDLLAAFEREVQVFTQEYNANVARAQEAELARVAQAQADADAAAQAQQALSQAANDTQAVDSPAAPAAEVAAPAAATAEVAASTEPAAVVTESPAPAAAADAAV